MRIVIDVRMLRLKLKYVKNVRNGDKNEKKLVNVE